MISRTRISLLAILLFIVVLNLNAQQNNGVIINEFMASNKSVIRDPDFGEYSDWIELYNDGTSELSIEGWYLTDDPDNPTKWPVKTSVVKPGEFRGYWADGQDYNWHTNFLLSKESGFIGLYNSDTLVVDSLSYPEQRTDISFGRAADDPDSWYYFSEPTPARKNADQKFTGFSTLPQLVLQSGFYNSPVTATIISFEKGEKIYYTLDGSQPDSNSLVYHEPITIESTAVLKAVTVKNNFMNSGVVSNTYFINEATELPVFSITTDPKNFFDDRIGIYVEGVNGIAGLCSDLPKNWNQDWERPIHVEFYESDRTLVLKQDAGIKISGGCSRIYPQKSLALWARNDYGNDTFRYQFFKDRDVEDYNSIVLRTSAQDWWRTMFRDGMIHTLFKGNLDIDYQDYRPSIVFLNGEYYGIHNIREKLNEHYIESNFNVERGNIDLIEISKNVRVKEGDEIAYNHLRDFLTNTDLTVTENYNYVKTLINMDEYIDYVIAEIYVANGDWPGNNIKAWRRKSPAGKFRWMIFDLDFGFGGNSMGRFTYNSLKSATDTNGPDWPNPPWSTLMLRRLLTNESFKNEFIQRFAYHVDTTFDPDRVLSVIDSLQTRIAAEIPRHKERWEKSVSFTDTWDEGVEIMREFARERPKHVKNHFSDKFNLGGTANLTLKTNEGNGGFILAYNKILTDSLVSHEFFKKATILLEARAKPGFRFTGWSGIPSGEGNFAEVIMNYNLIVTANFLADSSFTNTLVINEINYNSRPEFDVEDWVEIYNPTGATVDISGWEFKDSVDSHSFQFPDNTLLNPDSYIVLCRDTSAFSNLLPDVENYIGNFDFGLSNGGEYIRIYDNIGLLVDSVKYLDVVPWPIEPDGTGSTLSLLDSELDNSLPGSWFASEDYGTPGRNNDEVNPIESENLELPSVYKLSQNYPNPFNPSTSIKYSIPGRTEFNSVPQTVLLKVFDVLGRQVAELVNEQQRAGNYEVRFDATNLSSGVYFYTLQSNDFISSKKMLLIK